VTHTSAWASGSLLCVGVSHHTAPLDIRERLSLGAGQWQASAPGMPHLLLTTCNRTELFAWDSGQGDSSWRQLSRALARAAGFTSGELTPHVFVKRGLDAMLHLVRVAAGLDSLVVGEEQILGQIRLALRVARDNGTSNAPLDGVVSRAVEASRRIRGATWLGRRPSLAAAAVLAAQGTPELCATGLAGRRALVLGAGVMGRSAAQSLVAAGARVSVLNRTLDHAERLSRELGELVRPAALDALPLLLADASVLVAATGARRFVVESGLVRSVVVARHDASPLVLVDVGLPRNIDPAVRAIPGVRLIDLDDLERLRPNDAAGRQAELDRAEVLAVEAARSIESWLRVRAIGPAIADLRRQGEAARSLELGRAAQRLAGLTPQQRAAVDQLTEAIVNKLLHGPTIALRQTATDAISCQCGCRPANHVPRSIAGPALARSSTRFGTRPEA
jgi:glutamyl-tRNA reductase